jgi:hypothetical protein
MVITKNNQSSLLQAIGYLLVQVVDTDPEMIAAT